MQKYGVINDFTSINSSMVMWISIPFLFYVYIKDIIDRKRKLNICDHIFYFLILIGIIVSIFAIYPEKSVFGISSRREGFLTLISYYLLFINWKSIGTKQDIKKYIKIFMIIGIINSIYALFQIYTPFKFILRYKFDPSMANGLCGNPNFFGLLIVMLLGILSTKILIDKKSTRKEKLLFVLFFVSLINCQSTGPMLAYLVTIIFIICMLKIKKLLINKKILVLLLLLVIAVISTIFLPYVEKSIIRLIPNSKNFDIVAGKRCELCDIKTTIDSGGNSRLLIWGNTLNVVKKYPILGVGYDNLGYAYPNPKYTISFSVSSNSVVKETQTQAYVDNAHNVYLHTLATSGIFGLIPILVLMLYTFIKGIKSNDKLIIILFAGFVAYSCAAFVNISVIEVAPIYYIIIGLILSNNMNKDKTLT